MKKQQTKYVYDIDRNWLLVDAENKTLGRLASEISISLMGKNSVNYTPSADVGDFVVVYNAAKLIVTGKKETQKLYFNHSRFPGGLKSQTYRELMSKYPERILYNAVKGMLPKNKLANKLLTKLKIYAGSEHPHSAQFSQRSTAVVKES